MKPPSFTHHKKEEPLWPLLLRPLLFISSLALLAYFVHGLTLALVLSILGLLLLLVNQTRHLATLRHWIRSEDNADFPQTRGEWGEVFLELSRKQRESKQNTLLIKEEMQAFVDAVNALPDGVVLLEQHNRILWCNKKAETHMGINTHRDIGSVLPQLFRVSGFNDYLNQAIQEKPFIFQSPHLSSRTYALETVRYGTLRKLIITFDITEMQRADAMRRDFVANVSHELRTPLTVVSGFLEHFIAGDALSSEQRQRFVQLMYDQSQRMLRLVDDLLALSRLEADDAPQNEEYIALPEFIAGLINEGEALSNGRHRLILDEAVQGQLRGNRHELRSALGNLISNAVRYSPTGSQINLSWKIRHNEGVFTVKDAGGGIAAEHIPRLTERFYRVDKGRSRDTGGTGLGLAIVKHALMRHQAQLNIQSTLGSGSTFSAHFPSWRCHA